MARKINKKGEGSYRQIDSHTWECVLQSKYPNPETMNPKRFKRRGETKEEAFAKAKRDLDAFEKAYKEKLDYRMKKTMTFMYD